MEGRFFTPGAIAPVPPPQRGAVLAAAAPDATEPLHDPPLEPHDEVIFLLTAAAEIEHALMAQYLYAAWSVQAVDPPRQEVRDLLLQIAREEMGHLATVQNLLLLVGGPLHLDRAPNPSADDIYPFRFTLEPVSSDSLAKYVTAESPSPLPAGLSPDDERLLATIRADAARANGGQEVRHVGRIFARLAHLFAVDLADEEVRTDSGGHQADVADWGYEPGSAAAGEPLIVVSFPGTDAAALRQAAAAAVNQIGAQGEGFDAGPVGTESHFERFFDIYKKVAALAAAGTAVARPVATNPGTSAAPTGPLPDGVAAAVEAHRAPGRITAPRARAWAQLFNLRYRLLLGQLAHFLTLDGPPYSAEPGPGRGDRTARGLLLMGTFDEMRHLSKIAGKLVQLPKDDPPSGVFAGAPFELPYTLDLPAGEPQRWRMHLEASRAAVRLVRDRLPAGDPFLGDLVARDTTVLAAFAALARGGPVPADALPAGFAKAVTILEEAVRGFTIGAHGNLWAGTTRDEFLALRFFGQPPVAVDGNGNVDPDPTRAPLMQRLTDPVPRRRMPRFRPAVPADRIAYLGQWIRDGCPDDDPRGAVGVRHERDPAPEPTGPAGTTLSFAADIKVLFRADVDRTSMLFRFDLHRFEDVRDHAGEILTRLEDGTMPCDQPWPAERIDTFRRWITEGSRP